jgi:hypothetical protein
MHLRLAPASVLSLCVLAVSVAALRAQSPVATGVPRLVRVTSSFRPADGQPPAPVETMTLSIYSQDTGGVPLWQETQTVAVNPDGRFTLLIGSTRPEGLPLDLFASGEPRWLAVRVQRPGEGEPGRVLLASVPYALRASDAETLGGRPASEYVVATPDAHQNAATSSETPAPLANTGTNNFVAKFIGPDLGNSTIYEVSGYVGVGTTQPFDRLHVKFTDAGGGLTGYAVQNLSSSATAYSGMLFFDQNGALGQFQGFNNTTHEYRINNIAGGGTINFMINSLSKFLVGNNGDITIQGALLKGGQRFLWDGVGNTGVGLAALNSVTTSAAATNTAVGAGALQSLTSGGGNVAVGESALSSITSTVNNTAIGYASLNGTTGTQNLALGSGAGQNQSGSANIFVGNGAGANQTGSTNLYLGFITGQSRSENQTIRIGDNPNYYTRLFVAGVRAVTTGNSDAVPVMIDSLGQLGTMNSSRRYKEDIQDMGDASSRLMQLRPVTFRYKQPYAGGGKPIDYGLIAEEVEAVYPDVVAHSADGQVETVQYQKVNTMLLNEVQKQYRELERQKSEIEALKARLSALERAKR